MGRPWPCAVSARPPRVVRLGEEHHGRLAAALPLRFPLALIGGLAELGRLELKRLGMLGARAPLVVELGTQYLELVGLDPDQFCLLGGHVLLVGDLLLDGHHCLGLLEEGLSCVRGGDDGEHGKDGGRDRRDDGHAEEGHGRNLRAG